MEENVSTAEDGKPAEEPVANGDAAVEELTAALAEAQVRLDDSQDKLLRVAAELENFRKRAARDLEHARKFALETFARELLQVRDSLELGLAATEGRETTVESLREGTGMTLRLMEQVMEKFGIAQIDPQDSPFNPELHEAMVMIESDKAPNSVVEVVQKGYQINERLLRPARVIVAKVAARDSGDSA